jgi:hypothetical protein
MTIEETVAKYLELTGQTRQEVFAGAEAFGMNYVMTELIPQALKEKKKITWKDEPSQGLGAMSFTLQDL